MRTGCYVNHCTPRLPSNYKKILQDWNRWPSRPLSASCKQSSTASLTAIIEERKSSPCSISVSDNIANALSGNLSAFASKVSISTAAPSLILFDNTLLQHTNTAQSWEFVLNSHRWHKSLLPYLELVCIGFAQIDGVLQNYFESRHLMGHLTTNITSCGTYSNLFCFSGSISIHILTNWRIRVMKLC